MKENIVYLGDVLNLLNNNSRIIITRHFYEDKSKKEKEITYYKGSIGEFSFNYVDIQRYKLHEQEVLSINYNDNFYEIRLKDVYVNNIYKIKQHTYIDETIPDYQPSSMVKIKKIITIIDKRDNLFESNDISTIEELNLGYSELRKLVDIYDRNIRKISKKIDYVPKNKKNELENKMNIFDSIGKIPLPNKKSDELIIPDEFDLLDGNEPLWEDSSRTWDKTVKEPSSDEIEAFKLLEEDLPDDVSDDFTLADLSDLDII